ncbi:MAG: hypothetical protein RBT81_12485, partial [Gammaproteobacteria bacterium]|nr:hypothetical protein [Gammaproteobacteria bacterium]
MSILFSDADLLSALKYFGAQLVNVGSEDDYETIWALPNVNAVDVLEIETVDRLLRCRASDLDGVARGTGVTVAEGESYSVLRVRQRNDGLADVLLVAYGAAVEAEEGENGHDPPPKPPKPGEDEPEP